MGTCSGCGSPVSEAQVVCEFCGKTLRTVTDPTDEVRAVSELGRAWSKIGQDLARNMKGGLNAFSADNPLVLAGKGKVFWETAFMPTTLDGLLAAGEQALGLLRPNVEMNDIITLELNKAITARLQSVLEICELRGGIPTAITA